jgi:hypothetical protein
MNTTAILATTKRRIQLDSVVTKSDINSKSTPAARRRRFALAPVLARNAQSTRRTFLLAPRTPTRLTVRSAAKRAAMNLFDWNRRDADALSPRASRFVVLLRRENAENAEISANLIKRRRVDGAGVRWCDADATLVGAGAAHDDETLFP